jgi:hypothetical protein
MAQVGARHKVDKVIAIESRGFIFGSAVAQRLGVGVVPVRKKGKLPYKTLSATYTLEYGQDTLEMHVDGFFPGSACWWWTMFWPPGEPRKLWLGLSPRRGASRFGRGLRH